METQLNEIGKILDDLLAAYKKLLAVDTDDTGGLSEAQLLLQMQGRGTESSITCLLEPIFWKKNKGSAKRDSKGWQYLRSVAKRNGFGKQCAESNASLPSLEWIIHRNVEIDGIADQILSHSFVEWMVVLSDPVALATTYFVRLGNRKSSTVNRAGGAGISETLLHVTSVIVDAEMTISSRLQPLLAQERIDIVFLLPDGQEDVWLNLWLALRSELTKAQEEGVIPGFFDLKLLRWKAKGKIDARQFQRIFLSHHYIPIREYLLTRARPQERTCVRGEPSFYFDIQIQALRAAITVANQAFGTGNFERVEVKDREVHSRWVAAISKAVHRLSTTKSDKRKEVFQNLFGLAETDRQNSSDGFASVGPALRGILEVGTGARIFGLFDDAGVHLPLAPFTIIAGPNRGGKSTVVESLVCSLTGKEFAYDPDYPHLPPLGRNVGKLQKDKKTNRCKSQGKDVDRLRFEYSLSLLSQVWKVTGSNILQPQRRAIPESKPKKSFSICTTCLIDGGKKKCGDTALFSSRSAIIDRSIFTNDWIVELTKTPWDKAVLLQLAEERNELVQAIHDMYRLSLAVFSMPSMREEYQMLYAAILRSGTWSRIVEWLYSVLKAEVPAIGDKEANSHGPEKLDGLFRDFFTDILGVVARDIVAEFQREYQIGNLGVREEMADSDYIQLALQNLHAKLRNLQHQFLEKIQNAKDVKEFNNIVLEYLRNGKLEHRDIVWILLLFLADCLVKQLANQKGTTFLHTRLVRGILGLLPREEWNEVLQCYATVKGDFPEKPQNFLRGLRGVLILDKSSGGKEDAKISEKEFTSNNLNGEAFRQTSEIQRQLVIGIPYLFNPLTDFAAWITDVTKNHSSAVRMLLTDVFFSARPFLWTFEDDMVNLTLSSFGTASYELKASSSHKNRSGESEKEIENLSVLDVFNYGDRLTVVLSLIVASWLSGVFNESSVLVIDDLLAGLDQKQSVHAGLFLYDLRRIVDAYVKAYKVSSTKGGAAEDYGRMGDGEVCDFPCTTQIVIATIDLSEMLFLRQLVALPATPHHVQIFRKFETERKLFRQLQKLRIEHTNLADQRLLDNIKKTYSAFSYQLGLFGVSGKNVNWQVGNILNNSYGPLEEWILYWDRGRWAVNDSQASVWPNDFGVHILPGALSGTAGDENGTFGRSIDFYGGLWMFRIDPIMSVDFFRRLLRAGIVKDTNVRVG